MTKIRKMIGADQNHSFNPNIVLALGGHVKKAILLKEIYRWCFYNEQHDKNIDSNGDAWFFHSASAFARDFPYMTKPSISRWLNELEKDGWIESKIENFRGYDDTKSYRINEAKYSSSLQIIALSQNETPPSQNETNPSQNETNPSQNEKPIQPIKEPIKEPFYLKEKIDSVNARIILGDLINDDEILKKWGQAIMKQFDSKEAAKYFYRTVLTAFCSLGYQKYHSSGFESKDKLISSFISWAARAKYEKLKRPHQLIEDYTSKEILFEIKYLQDNGQNQVQKIKASQLTEKAVRDFFKYILIKILENKQLEHLAGLSPNELVRICMAFKGNKKDLTTILGEKSKYAAASKTCFDFITKQYKYQKDGKK